MQIIWKDHTFDEIPFGKGVKGLTKKGKKPIDIFISVKELESVSRGKPFGQIMQYIIYDLVNGLDKDSHEPSTNKD